MFSFPTLPPLEGVHPLVVHFPIALLLTAWIPMILGLFLKDKSKHWWIATMLWLGLGVTGALAAVFTGEAAEEIAIVTTDAAKTLLHEHEEAGELTRTLFIITFLLYLATFLLKYVWSVKKQVVLAAAIITALVYAASTLVLINTAHQGGLLVHQHSILAPLGNTNPATSASPSSIQTEQPSINHDDEDDDD